VPWRRGRAMFAADMLRFRCFKSWRAGVRGRFCGRWLCFGLLACVAAGCAHSSRTGGEAGVVETFPAPLPPVFLNGPMALLLTNQAGFRAHVVLDHGAGPRTVGSAAGELIGRDRKLFFAPAAAKVARKQARPEDSAFVWDVAEHRGWVLNEPLQGYAPISSSRVFTNVAVQAGSGAAAERISGYSCVPGEVTVTADDGVPAVFVVWRAQELQGLPLRIESRATGVPVVLTLSRVRLEAVPADLFQPPNGFTKYASTETMMSELFLRTHNLSHRQVAPMDVNEPITPDQAPTRSN
jgi:hypothetical protein